MPLELQVIRACEFVRLGVHGEFDFESTRAALITLADACRKRGVERALIDVRGASSNLTPNDLAALVNAFGEAAVSRRLRLAILHTGDQAYRAKLFVFFSAMRGRKVRAIENFEEGLDWLSTQDDADAEYGAAKLEVPIQSEQRSRTKIAVKDEPSDH
jgi:hypothetical protein